MASECHECGQPAVPVYDGLKRRFVTNVKVCRPCAESGKATWYMHPFDYRKVFAEKGWAFSEVHPLMPEAYRETRKEALPSPSMQQAFDWSPDEKRSLLLHGTTGCGKTRVAWAVFNKLWMQGYPKAAEFLPMRKVEGKIEKGFDDRDHGEVIEYLISVPLLCLDDLGKERMTPRLEADLFAVLDERTANHAVTIITTNFNSAGLVQRFTNQETGPAFVRRLKDYFRAFGA